MMFISEPCYPVKESYFNQNGNHAFKKRIDLNCKLNAPWSMDFDYRVGLKWMYSG